MATTTHLCLWLFLEVLDIVQTLRAVFNWDDTYLCFYASTIVLLCDDHERGSASQDLPSPVSIEAYWMVPKYVCCKNYSCTRTLAMIKISCGMYFCRQV